MTVDGIRPVPITYYDRQPDCPSNASHDVFKSRRDRSQRIASDRFIYLLTAFFPILAGFGP